MAPGGSKLAAPDGEEESEGIAVCMSVLGASTQRERLTDKI